MVESVDFLFWVSLAVARIATENQSIEACVIGFNKLIYGVQIAYCDRAEIDSGFFYPGSRFSVFRFPWLELGDCLMASIHQGLAPSRGGVLGTRL